MLLTCAHACHVRRGRIKALRWLGSFRRQRRTRSGPKRGTMTALWHVWTRRSHCLSPASAIPILEPPLLGSPVFCSAAARYHRFLLCHFGRHGFHLGVISEHYNAHTLALRRWTFTSTEPRWTSRMTGRTRLAILCGLHAPRPIAGRAATSKVSWQPISARYPWFPRSRFLSSKR